MMATYHVFMERDRVGTLTADRGRLSFICEVAARSTRWRLSVRLPRHDGPFDDSATRGYFGNLLPESEFRRLVASALGLSPGNVAGLLGAIGGECVGAVSVWPAGQGPEPEPRYRDVDDRWLSEVFAPANAAGLAEAQEQGRLSTPGVEDKLALRREGDRWQLPLAGAPSTHILKRPRPGFSGLVANDHFCTELARASGFGAVETSIGRDAEGMPLYIVSRRFDRHESGGAVSRKHQEDFCQALGLPPSQKYEAEGGPSFASIAAALREHSAIPVADLARLVQWAAFNYMIGNEDAHGKNVAFAYDTDGAIRLAPFYDLLCTEIYKGLKRKGAMCIGCEYLHRTIGRDDWLRFGADVGLRERAVLNQVAAGAESVRDALLSNAVTIADADDPDGTVASIRAMAVHRAAILLGHRRGA